MVEFPYTQLHLQMLRNNAYQKKGVLDLRMDNEGHAEVALLNVYLAEIDELERLLEFAARHGQFVLYSWQWWMLAGMAGVALVLAVGALWILLIRPV